MAVKSQFVRESVLGSFVANGWQHHLYSKSRETAVSVLPIGLWLGLQIAFVLFSKKNPRLSLLSLL